MTTSKTTSKRALALSLRQAQVTSLNLTTENHGKDNRVPRLDVSLRFLAENLDMPQILDCKGNALETLWHTDGTPSLRELNGPIRLTTKIEGECTLGLDDENAAGFEGAILKSVTVAPIMKHQAEIACQVRIDPSASLNLLEDMLVAGKGVFSFTGESGADSGEPENQEQMNV